jgi:type VI secretion system secreted protein Hcp
MQDFHFTVFHGVASPKLMLACATGQHIPSAVLTARKAGKDQQEYMKVSFYDLLISSFQTGGSSGSVNPTVKAMFDLKKMQGS